MRLGSFILKPDFFENKSYYKTLMNLLAQNDCKVEGCFVIKDYLHYNNEYRKLDLKKRYANEKEFEKNFSRSKIAYESYAMSNYNNTGLLLLIKHKKKLKPKEFYIILTNIKENLRQHIKEQRNFVFLYLKKDNGEAKLLNANENDFTMLEDKYGKNIKLAFINGIHLEDFNLFKKNFCFKTFKNLGIANQCNSINPQDIPALFDNSTDIDLHIHSNYSDGVYSCEEIYEKCKLMNIKYSAICDHDGFNVKIKNFDFINGVEFNCIANEKKQHILCYNFTAGNKRFLKIMQIQKNNRIKLLHYRLKQLEELYSFSFMEEDINDIINNNHFSREYIAQLLVKYHYCASVEEGLSNYINKLDHGKFLIDLKRLSKLIHKAKGFLVLAHPLGNYKKRISFEDFSQSSSSLTKYVDGIETFYSLYNNKEIKNLFDFAQQNKLICTCGSDYHGSRPIDEQIGKICKEKLDFENMCNYLIVKKQIEDKIFKKF